MNYLRTKKYDNKLVNDKIMGPNIEYWRDIVSKSKMSEIISITETEGNEECWNDWLKCDNEYAINDRKAMEAGGGKNLNFIAIILRKK